MATPSTLGTDQTAPEVRPRPGTRPVAGPAGLFVPAQHRPWSKRDWSAAVLAVVGGTALSLGRTPGLGALDTVWLEDGQLFLHDAVTRPGLAFVTPYSGYYHLLPRLLAAAASALPAGAAAAALAVEAALAASVLAVIVYVASAAHLRSPALRIMVAAPILLTAAGYTEVPNAINELRWPFMYAMFWVLLWVPTSRSGRVVGLTTVAVAAFTDSVVAIFLPLVLLRLYFRRDRYAKVACTIMTLSLGVNLTTNLLGISVREDVHHRFNPAWAIAAYVLRPLPQGLLGEAWTGLRPEHTVAGLAPVALGWFVVLVCVLVAWRRWSDPDWPLAVTAAFYSVAIYSVVIMLVGITAPRYSYPAALLVLTAVVALVRPPAGGWVGTGPPRLRAGATPALALGVLMVVVAAVNYRGVDSLRGHGPSWSHELSVARAQCVAGATEARILVSPGREAYYAVLPCSYLTR